MANHFTIKEFEKITGISSHTLRFFDKIDLLVPIRSENGYRQYSLAQVAQAQVIILLQKARFTNAEIVVMLQEHLSENTVAKLKVNRAALRKEITQLNRVYDRLGESIVRLEELAQVRNNLNQPFCELREVVKVGLVEQSEGNIVDLFSTIHHKVGDYSWSHLNIHGLRVPTAQVQQTDYPVVAMYACQPKLQLMHPYEIDAGRYLSMYCAGSMESNPQVAYLIELARQWNYEIGEYVYIQQVSGPTMERDKQDFLVKILLPIDGDNSALE